jgi:hypothetical protein
MSAIDKLVSSSTAFGTWGEMATALYTGYVPTLFGRTRRERLLRKVIRAKGYRVWPQAMPQAI